MKHYILDGNNILHKHSGWAELFKRAPAEACRALLISCESFLKIYPSYKLSIVFDGQIPPVSSTLIKIFAAQPADKKIKDLIRTFQNPKLAVVVSSDTEVWNYARLNTATALRSEDFLKELPLFNSPTQPAIKTSAAKTKTPKEKPSGVSKNEIQIMKKLFGLE
ncbi:MAG TPA: NYN domain-containing protein [Patescibacteria group bacterium]|nr:NYN domain-containing protein [Patescibacteria group bacterium]